MLMAWQRFLAGAPLREIEDDAGEGSCFGSAESEAREKELAGRPSATGFVLLIKIRRGPAGVGRVLLWSSGERRG